MSIKDIPFIICNYNQLSYLRGLISQIQFYYPDNSIFVIDNGSNYAPLLAYYSKVESTSVLVFRHSENDFIGNLSKFLAHGDNQFPYFVLTDPDLLIHPATPPNFLEIFKAAIDNYGFHHAGFGLITEDIPAWNPKAGWIQGDEKALLNNPVSIEHEGNKYAGFRAPIDTCFALYKRDNGGWQAPMSGENWGNSLRLFSAFHLPFYLDAKRLNPEMQHYYATCKRRELGQPSAGRTHYAPDGV